MRQVDLTIEICGSSGDGTLAVGEILVNTLSDLGYRALSFDVYPAEIRGFGKCVAHCRVSDKPVYSVGRSVDALVSLNDPYSIEQLATLKPGGVVLFDSWPLREVSEESCVAGRLGPGMYLYGVPFGELSQRSTHGARSRNLVALGAIAGLFDIDAEAFEAGLDRKFGGKKGNVAQTVKAAFRAGHDYVKEKLLKVDPVSFAVKEELEKKDFQIMNGNQAAARGAIEAGCRFYAGYPITPATKIMEILSAKLPPLGGRVVQAEDEISAIGMVTGAAMMGTRAMTATSGPGVCLMTEFIGYNVMTENPVVIVDSQRGGPATGLPTKTEQSDLLLALFSGNGDAPRIVVAPTSVEECHYWTSEAFYLAEKYQTPVILLMDLFLSTCKTNAVLSELDKAKLSANKSPSPGEEGVGRFKVTEDGVSPRALPGTPGFEWTVSGLEQNELDSPSYYANVHTEMTEKRARKLMTALQNDVPRPERFGAKGKVKLGVMGWGSTMGAVIEAVERANEAGLSAAALKQVVLNPLHVEDIEKFVDDCEKILVPELNYSGQFARWLSMHVNKPIHGLNMVKCSPLTYLDVLEEIERLITETS